MMWMKHSRGKYSLRYIVGLYIVEIDKNSILNYIRIGYRMSHVFQMLTISYFFSKIKINIDMTVAMRCNGKITFLNFEYITD